MRHQLELKSQRLWKHQYLHPDSVAAPAIAVVLFEAVVTMVRRKVAAVLPVAGLALSLAFSMLLVLVL
jgi:hypothetical protein